MFYEAIILFVDFRIYENLNVLSDSPCRITVPAQSAYSSIGFRGTRNSTLTYFAHKYLSNLFHVPKESIGGIKKTNYSM